jgi:hypothetical protein
MITTLSLPIRSRLEIVRGALDFAALATLWLDLSDIAPPFDRS